MSSLAGNYRGMMTTPIILLIETFILGLVHWLLQLTEDYDKGINQ